VAIQKEGTVLIQNEGSVGATSRPAPQLFFMYAIRPINDIYHVVTCSGQDTLCGLRVSRITFDRTGNRLQLVNEEPVGRSICKHCERIKSQETSE